MKELEFDALKMIEERHSVRQYYDRPLSDEHLKLLQEALDIINAESGLRMVYISESKGVFKSPLLKLIGWRHFPGYIAVIAKDTEDREERCGYYGEKLVLYLQSIGLNTCWLGMFRRSAVPVDLAPGEKVVVTIATGYGRNQGAPHKSKTFEDVTRIESDEIPNWFRNGTECALLAPTAVNRQDFLITLDDGKAAITSTGTGHAAMTNLGIVKYHFEIGSKY